MDEIEKTSGVLSRYLLFKARTRGRQVDDGLDANRLVYPMRRGNRVFYGEIEVDPKAWPPIIGDAQDEDLFQAIIKGRDDAIDMPADELNHWRKYILHAEGTPPPGRADD